MAESKMPARIWAWGGTASGWTPRKFINEIPAREYVRADLVEPLVEALRFYSGVHERGLSNPNAGPWGVNSTDFGERARAALSSWEAAQ